MRNRFTTGFSGLALVLAAGCAAAHRSPAAIPGGDAGVVHVAPPTGTTEIDRASILAALDQVEPGGTIQFAPGTYLVGAIVLVRQPGITLQAHSSGTTLRGCEPGQAGESVLSCGMMVLLGGGVTVRGFTIEQSQLGVCISTCLGDPQAPVGDTVGGYRIEDNTFRNSLNGVRGQVVSSDTSFIRDNLFINTFHAVSFLEASNLHVIDNRISAPEPEQMPGFGHVSFAIAVGGSSNLIARNRIAGHPDGILLAADPGGTSSRNVIRENTIDVARNRLPSGGSPALASSDPADSTIVGVPLALHGLRAARDTTQAGRVSDNLVEDNRILGAEGIGIELSRASGNRIVGNQVSGIVPRRPFPGNSVSTDPEPWREANGSGIWVSPESDRNEIVGNVFEEIAASAIVIEGDSNRVELLSADDTVRDLGTGNRVTRAATAQEWTDPSPHEIRFVAVAPDVRLEVLDWGGDGLPLVFLAGANFNAHSFDDFAPRFTDTHRVLGVTRRGHGASSWPDSGYDLPTLVEDIRLVLDSLGIDRAILAGHSMAGAEMTLLATESPDRVAGLIYIDAGHDPTDIGRLRVEEHCANSFSPGFLEAMERTFENPELVRRTQWQTGEDGVRRPFASAAALAGIDASLPTPDYSGVVAPALGIYYVPERTEDLFMGLGDPAAACVAAFHRYIHGGIAAFMEGVEQATVIPLSETNHNIHLASPDTLEAVMRRWLATVPGLAFPAAAQRSDAALGQHDLDVRLDSANALIEVLQDTSDVVGLSAAIVVDGRLIWSRSYGYANLQHRVEAGPALLSNTEVDVANLAEPILGIFLTDRRE